jgi:hypothetical protein
VEGSLAHNWALEVIAEANLALDKSVSEEIVADSHAQEVR